jgi:hypothetical protein
LNHLMLIRFLGSYDPPLEVVIEQAGSNLSSDRLSQINLIL